MAKRTVHKDARDVHHLEARHTEAIEHPRHLGEVARLHTRTNTKLSLVLGFETMNGHGVVLHAEGLEVR